MKKAELLQMITKLNAKVAMLEHDVAKLNQTTGLRPVIPAPPLWTRPVTCATEGVSHE